ncbi:MAG: hypothetical protein ACREP2_01075 [Rhodanobacteraceae bacterium]
MKTILTLAGVALIAAGLAACSPKIHGRFGYDLDFRNGELVAHAPDQPNAYIGADGGLRVGDRTIAVTPQQRALLKDYYGESKAIVAEGEATGKAGAKFAVHTIGHAMTSIFAGDSKQADTQLNAQGNAIRTSAQKICAGANRLHELQQTIAAQLPAFKPYQTFDKPISCNVTTTGSSVAVATPASSRSTANTATTKKSTAQ